MSYIIARPYPNEGNKFDLEFGHCLGYKSLKVAKKELENYRVVDGWRIYKIIDLNDWKLMR